MEIYSYFSKNYDIFMDNVPYEQWVEEISLVLKQYGIQNGLVLDLGCGTGTVCELLSGKGYEMIGIDASVEMLDMAIEKRDASGRDILYLCQDMREFELYGTVAAVISICDSLNYITDYDELVQVFSLVNNYLDPGGLFLFDMNTEYKYLKELGECVIAENRPEGSFIWENSYDEEQRINEYNLTIFSARSDGLFEKQEETHWQRAYMPGEVIDALKAGGLEPAAVYASFSGEELKEDSGRMCIIARECTKNKKNKESKA